jgi:hypothetical protein
MSDSAVVVQSEVYPHPIRTEWKILAQLRADNPASTAIELARLIGVNENTIRFWTKKPLYQSYENWFLRRHFEHCPVEVRLRREEVQEQLDEFAQEMLFRLKDIAETTNDQKLLTSIGWDALDRAGYGAVKRESARPINLILTAEVLATIQRRSAEADTAIDAVVVGQMEQGA